MFSTCNHNAELQIVQANNYSSSDVKAQNKYYNGGLVLVWTFDVFVFTAAIF